MRRTTPRALAVIAAGALAFSLPAGAAWGTGAGGNGAAAARSMPAGNTPTASAALLNVTVSWTASSFAGGGAVPGYAVTRINALTGARSTACGGVVTGTSCVDSPGVGQWKYAVTPAAGSWRGAESAQSNAVIVA